MPTIPSLSFVLRGCEPIMLADSLDRPVGVGALAKGVLLPGTFLLRIIDFVADQLPLWLRHPHRPSAESERVLSDQLCSHLNSAARDSFDFIQFSAEVPDSVHHGRSLDVAAKPSGVEAVITIEGKRYTQFDVLLPIECKRLPTPRDGGRDEREYVTTDGGRTTGGIQRFKLGAHGSAHDLAAMIGFIQDGEAEHWCTQINQWLAEEAKRDHEWSDEQLTPASVRASMTVVYRLRSRHRRRSGLPPIELQHLWVLVSNGVTRTAPRSRPRESPPTRTRRQSRAGA
jgi:hypothetical protein